jgi:predicted component of type VI protein secretion system
MSKQHVYGGYKGLNTTSVLDQGRFDLSPPYLSCQQDGQAILDWGEVLEHIKQLAQE